MCEQCVTNPEYYDISDILPGWVLIRARKTGDLLREGQWGLINCNDPEFAWDTQPTPCPSYQYHKEGNEKSITSEEDKWGEMYDDFRRGFNQVHWFVTCPKVAWDLVESARKGTAKFNTEKEVFMYWLFHHLGLAVNKGTFDPYELEHKLEGIGQKV